MLTEKLNETSFSLGLQDVLSRRSWVKRELPRVRTAFQDYSGGKRR